jgi:hypothetical protein
LLCAALRGLQIKSEEDENDVFESRDLALITRERPCMLRKGISADAEQALGFGKCFFDIERPTMGLAAPAVG